MEQRHVSLTDDEWNFIVNALRFAAERYEIDRGTMVSADQPRLAEQFERQAREAERLASQIEESI